MRAQNTISRVNCRIYKNLIRAIENFMGRINGGDQVVVFYAGHGVQIKSGNYLLPIDIEAGSETEIEKTAYSLDDLTTKLSEAKAGFSLVMVDACRDNPLKVAGRSIGGNRGLSAVEPPKGQMVVFSASRGQQALDKLSDKDNNPNGVFTREFIARMKKPNVRIEDMMREVQDAVEKLAKSVHHEQRPALYNESRGNFYFYGSGSPQVTIATGNAGSDPESETWEAANSTNTLNAYQAYLKAYPNGRYAAAANIKIDALKTTSISKPVSVPTAVAPVPAPSPVTGREDADTALWRAVEQGGSVDDYKVYIQQYPKGKFVALAKQRLQKLQEQAERDAEVAEQTSWAQAMATNTSQAYSSYISNYPMGRFSALAKVRIDKLKTDEAQAQRQAELQRQKEQEEAELRAKLEAQRLQREKELAEQKQEYEDWTKAQNAQDRAPVQYYLDKYPAGRFLVAAQYKLEEFKKKEAELSPGKIFKDCEDCPEMVVLPAGSFMMGSNEHDSEQPIHNVNIQAFAMGKTEVTQGQWKAVMGNNPSNFSNCGDTCPVEQVSWDDAQEFIRRLNAKTGKQYRLPSETEWEYACRGGANQTYCGSNNVDAVAVYNKNSGNRTQPVMSKQPNGFGLYDMSGNVWEWTQDCWNANYNGAPTNNAAWTTGNCGRRVSRGGSWGYFAIVTRSANRDRYVSTYRNSFLGFRLARMLP
jgi:formylglycine-generating enzyme required for sulfatase activity